MYFRVQLLRGLYQSHRCSHQMKEAEQIKGIWTRSALLLFTSLILFSISAYFGIGNESLSKTIYDLSPNEFETIKALFGIGQVIQGILGSILLLFPPALYFWVFTHVDYKKLVIMQLFILTIYLIEQALSIPFHIVGLDLVSLPFSFGVIAQYLTDYELIINFFSTITLFKIWSIILQTTFIKVLSEKSTKISLLIVIPINLFIWIFIALFPYIKELL
ncbi:hypothetical protein [Bacillus sp. 7884-1]|uniref:hypothetical protein n=1 Tax=Bacillus sp. 7884-1 TaxID=2021693 RepID=UPI000BA50AE0|nr:hypothetical protein [Bacillus sp. 7884-1]PAE44670.1 hypothetical protein CHI06_00125 [Bacillus sp. 7884-1]